MSRFQAVPYDDQSEINLSPMLDVVLIMLIFFIVVEPTSIFVVNGRSMTAASVQPYVQALYGENPNASFGVLLASGSKAKDAVVAIEAGRMIGFSTVPITRKE